jgi:intracellular septation protein
VYSFIIAIPSISNKRTFMKQLLDYLAIIAFAIVYFASKDIFLATGVLMVGVTLQVIAYKVMSKPIGNELKITFWVSMAMGGLTLLFRDEAFIQWKPSIVSWAIASALIGAHWFAKTFLLKKVLGHALQLPDEKWKVLTYGWALAFTFSGVLNLWVANNFSMDTWVTFKLFGQLGINSFNIFVMIAYLVASGALSEANLAAQGEGESDVAPNPSMPEKESGNETSPLTPSEETPK